MIETSAHLVDHVFPEVPVRQWVLSFPWPLRLLFARLPDALGRCLSVIIRAIQTNLAHRAGLTASAGARTGVVTLIQRFGSALNLNVHLHMLILDSVYTLEQNGPRFHRVGAPDARSLERLLNRLVRRIVRRLTRDGTTHILFSPEDFIARLAALVPRPRINLTRYHGVFAPSSPMRGAIVPTQASARQRRKLEDTAAAPSTRPCSSTESRGDCNDPPTAPLTWAQRLKRVFEIDITDPDLIRKILDHVNSRAPPRLQPRRAKSHQIPPDLFAER